MNPESRMFGRRKKNDICMACCCVLASVEKKSPIARFAAMNRNESAYKSGSDPTNGTSKTTLPARRMSVIWT
jgi:hypothetical protein